MNGQLLRQLPHLHQEHQEHLHQTFLMAIELGRAEPDFEAIEAHVKQVSAGLADHMSSEAEHLFPWLLEALPHRTSLVHALARQHAELVEILAQINHVLEHEPMRAGRPLVAFAKDFVHLLGEHTNDECVLVAEASALSENQKRLD